MPYLHGIVPLVGKLLFNRLRKSLPIHLHLSMSRLIRLYLGKAQVKRRDYGQPESVVAEKKHQIIEDCMASCKRQNIQQQIVLLLISFPRKNRQDDDHQYQKCQSVTLQILKIQIIHIISHL